LLAFSVDKDSADVADLTLIAVSFNAFQAPSRLTSGTETFFNNVSFVSASNTVSGVFNVRIKSFRALSAGSSGTSVTMFRASFTRVGRIVQEVSVRARFNTFVVEQDKSWSAVVAIVDVGRRAH
jgi:hypothetical protein